MHAAVEPAPSPAPARDAVIAARGLGKRYEIYGQPRDRLLQSLFRGRRQFFQEFWEGGNIRQCGVLQDQL